MTMEPVAANGPVPEQKKNRIQVSNTKKPLFFYVNLAKVESFFLLILFFVIPTLSAFFFNVE